VGAAAHRDIIIGWTRDEMGAFFSGNSEILNGSSEQVEAVFREQWGSNWEAGMAFARARTPSAAQDRFMDIGLNECTFAGSAVTLAERLASVNPAWLYRFDWAAPGNPFRACHCIELPFVFNNGATWGAPMLEGASPESLGALGKVVQHTWAQFVRTGDPNHGALPYWPRYDPEKRWTLRIDQFMETVGDLAGVTLPGRPWPANFPLNA
jgi:para-nitrobenzyl esterase